MNEEIDDTEDQELEKLKKKMVKDMMNSNNKSTMGNPKSPIEMNDKNFNEIITKYPLVIVDFWAAWCGPCKMMEPVIEDMAERYAGKVVFGKLNVDKNNRIPNKFSVSGIPTMIIFKNGEMVDRIVGAVRGPQLSQRIENIVNK